MGGGGRPPPFESATALSQTLFIGNLQETFLRQ